MFEGFGLCSALGVGQPLVNPAGASPRFAGCFATDAGADALSDWKRDGEICSMVCSELVA